ncbi:MAG: hypothetical protein IJ704_05180 [Bacilli bacterium]|nr:hypothetical protein [Bacilli bacterium]
MKELPKVYAQPFDKKINNNSEFFYSSFSDGNRHKNIKKEIELIFHSKDFVYKSDVEITTKNGIQKETIVGKTQGYILTMDGKKIFIGDILDIKKL